MSGTTKRRSIYNTFTIDADFIDLHGSSGSNNDVEFEAHGTSKILLKSDTQVPEGKKLLVSSVCDKDGTEIFSKDTTNNRVKFNMPIDFNNQAVVNFSGGGGGGATTTSGISSENLVGQTLEDELDAITTQQGTNTNNIATLTTQQVANTSAIGTNSANITANTTAIGTNTQNVATNTTAISGLLLQQQTNSTNIATNTAGVNGLQTQQATNTTNISALQTTTAGNTTSIGTLQTQQNTNTSDIAALTTTQNTQGTDITNLQTTQGTQGTAITNLQTTQGTQGTNITALQTTQGTQGTDITALQTQQALNVSAIASNTARTSNLTADRVLISSAVGTINTAGVGISDLATKNSSNSFNAPLGNPATQNSFDTLTASTITNTGTTESTGYTQGGAALNFSHLAGSVDKTQLATETVRTDTADQTIQGQPTTSSLTKLTIDNTHASGNSQFVVQKRSTLGVLEGGFTVQQTSTGTNITTQAPVGSSPDLSITPANGSLALSIGGLETRVHNNFKIIGSMSGAARSDNKDYIFKTVGATGTGDVLLLEDVLKRPTTGVPAAGFNPTAASVVEFSTSGIASYKALSDFLTLPAGLPTNPSAVLIDSAGSTSYLESSKVLTKPGGANPTATSFVAVNTGGSFSYIPSSFVPLPTGGFPSSNENVVFVNPAGTSYVERSNLIERPGNANPTSGTKLITINNVGTRAYKDLGQFLTTPSGANPSSDSFIKISSTGVQSYVAESSLGGGGIQKPGGANPGQQSLISLDTAGTETYLAESNLLKTTNASQTISTTTADANFTLSCGSTNIAHETVFRVERTGGVGDNHIEFRPKRGTFAEWECKNDLRILINGQTKMGVGNHSVDFFKPIVLQNGQDVRLRQDFVAPANSSSTGSFGTLGFDSNHLYIAVGTNSWKRVALSTF